MGEIVSFSKARKAKARTDKNTAAAENRAKFGRTKGQKTKEAADKAKAAAELDGKKRDD